MKLFKILVLLFLVLMFGCSNLKNIRFLKDTKFKEEIEDLIDINNITKKVYDAWKIDYNNANLPNSLPHTMKITYVVSISEGSGLVYYLFTDTYQKIGKLEDKNIDLYRTAILDQEKPQNYIFITAVCDEAFNTNFLERLADDRYDIKEVAEGIKLARTILENIILQVRNEKRSLEKLN